MRRPAGGNSSALEHPGETGTPPQGGALGQGGLTGHVLMGLGRGLESLHAQAACGVCSQLALTRAFWDQAAQYVARHGAAPQLLGGDLNFDLDRLLRAPPSILAVLLVRRMADAGLELVLAARRDPLCSYQGPEGTRPLRIDGKQVYT